MSTETHFRQQIEEKFSVTSLEFLNVKKPVIQTGNVVQTQNFAAQQEKVFRRQYLTMVSLASSETGRKNSLISERCCR